MRELVKASREVIEDQSQEIASLRRQAEYQHEQCLNIERDFKQHKELIESDIEKAR